MLLLILLLWMGSSMGFPVVLTVGIWFIAHWFIVIILAVLFAFFEKGKGS